MVEKHNKDQGSQDANSNTITNKGDGSLKLRIKINMKAKGIRNKNEQPCLCDHHTCNCNKGKALGGHMRMHALNKKQIHKGKEVTQGCKTQQQQHLADVNRNPTCSLCRRNFPSMKSLYGHMRFHPERQSRGIQPLTTSHDATSSNSSSDDSISNVDISSSLSKGWSVTAKRGRKRLSSSHANSDLEVEEAARTLILLSNGKWES